MMLAITIPDSGTWNAVLHDPTNHSHVLLENFRVHPIDSNSQLTRRTVMCSRSAPPRLEVGTPVNVRTDDGHVPGVIAHTTAETSLVDPVSDKSLMYVRNDAITYRMGVTIDDDRPQCHVVDGYLVPCREDRPVDSMRALKLSNVTTICSDMTLDAWVNRKLIDVVTYRKNEFATKPWVPESHENPTGSWRILIGAEYIHETHPDGDVGTSPITVTTNVLENLQINSCVPLYEIPANVELPCENDTTIVTGVGTHYLMQFAFVTVFAVDDLDEEEEHLVRSPPSQTLDMSATTIQNAYRFVRERRKRVRQMEEAHLRREAETANTEDVSMDNVIQLVDLDHTAHPDDTSWGLQDAVNPLNGVDCDMERAADIILPGTTADAIDRDLMSAPYVPTYTSFTPKNGNQTHETQLPKTLLDAMEPHLRSRRFTDKYEADGQARYVNVRPFVGRQSKTPAFRGYQVQLKLCNKRNVFLGNYARTTVGAIVATAAYMDAAFVHTSYGAAAWLDTMISNPSTASAWVDAVLANKFPPLIRRVS
jgi:hypothetical protein